MPFAAPFRISGYVFESAECVLVTLDDGEYRGRGEAAGVYYLGDDVPHMLAAIEDLLDSWAGTLLVVSHDRYFLERVTDQQYAVLGGHLRHLPGGIDEYLRLRDHERTAPASTGATGASASAPAAAPALGGADLRAAQKELQAAERRIEKLTAQADAARTALAEHDQSDYVGLGEKMRAIGELDAEIATLEERWFALTEQIG